MFLGLGFHKRIQSAVNLGHCCFLPATLIARGASQRFWANGLSNHAQCSIYYPHVDERVKGPRKAIRGRMTHDHVI